MCYCRLCQTKQSWKNFNIDQGSQQFALLEVAETKITSGNFFFFPIKSLALAMFLTVGGDGNGRQWIGGCLHQASERVMATSPLLLFQKPSAKAQIVWIQPRACSPSGAWQSPCGSMVYQLKSVTYACRGWEANKKGHTSPYGTLKQRHEKGHSTSKTER